MGGVGASVMVVSALDEVAWLLNLRGSDIAYNPGATPSSPLPCHERSFNTNCPIHHRIGFLFYTPVNAMKASWMLFFFFRLTALPVGLL
jgi:hypothetical protein